MVPVGGGGRFGGDVGGEDQGNTGLACLGSGCVWPLDAGRLCHTFCSVPATPVKSYGPVLLLGHSALAISCTLARLSMFGSRALAGENPGEADEDAASVDGGGKGGRKHIPVVFEAL